MSKSTVWTMQSSVASACLALALAGCGGSGGPTDNGPPAVAGNYNATFAATQATGCQGFVTAPSSTTGTLRVTQSGSSITLQLAELADQIASNAVGTIDEDGSFHFQGPVLLDPNPAVEDEEVPATGTIDGDFSGTSIDLTFHFTLGPCTVVGTIVGQR